MSNLSLSNYIRLSLFGRIPIPRDFIETRLPVPTGRPSWNKLI